MRFFSKMRQYVLVVIPTDYVIESGRRRTQRGLRAEFVEHTLDTERLQHQNRWSDAQRQEIERELLTNDDFGRAYWVDESDPASPVMTATPSRTEEGMCQVTFMTPEGAVRCANKAKSGSSYCAAHQTVAAKVGTPAEEPVEE